LNKNIQCIDLVRSLAILMVMAGHLKPTLPLPPPAFRWGWDHFQRTGPEGVYIFFLVSGFLITRIIDQGLGGILRPKWKYFYIRRIARLLPLFLFQIGLGLVLVWLFSDDSKKFIYCFKLPDPGTGITFWVSLFSFSFNWGSALFSKAWNGVGHHWSIFWSLAVEEQFYLFYPLILGFLGRLKAIAGFLFLGALASFSGVFLLTAMGVVVPIDVAGYIFSYGHIAIGALLYLTVKRYGLFFSKNPPISFALVAAGIVLILPDFISDWDGVHFLIAPGMFLFLLGGIHLRFFQSGHLQWLAAPGRYSYGNYLFHTAVLFFIHGFLWNLNIVLAFAVFVMASTVVSAFSFHFFETPANRWVRKIGNSVN
jgi:peptidoglycan/LPS O-acetylase OafA/YrhL